MAFEPGFSHETGHDMTIAVVLLVAGKGKRMKSQLPKVLHEIGGAPVYHHALQAVRGLGVSRIMAVTGHGAGGFDESCHELGLEIDTVVQPRLLGTADALSCALRVLHDHTGPVVVLYGDTPFISPETIANMLDLHMSGSTIVVLGFDTGNPGSYGRIVTDKDGNLLQIIEAADADEHQKAIRLCNAGIMCGDRQALDMLVPQIDRNNAAGEYYLTDLPAIAVAAGLRCGVIRCAEEEAMGINTRMDLARAEAIFQQRCRTRAMEAGVTLVDPDSVHFSHDTHLGPDVLVEPFVTFGKEVSVAGHARIRSFSYLESCSIGAGSIIGPYARIRPGTEIGELARIGNFVEIKGSYIGDGAKASHLAYIGDSDVGPEANIGAGTVICNYDGLRKHQTAIGPGTFIGSGTMLVAPVKIGEGSMTAAGSVITEDVAPDTLAIGRARQVNKPDLSRRRAGLTESENQADPVSKGGTSAEN